MLSFKSAFSFSSFTFIKRHLVLFAFCHKGGVICISEVIDIFPGNLDSSLCFIQPGIFHGVLCTIALISHASQIMLKIFQARLQQYVNRELLDVQAVFRNWFQIGKGVHQCYILSSCLFNLHAYLTYITLPMNAGNLISGPLLF